MEIFIRSSILKFKVIVVLQDRRNRRSRTASMEIESMKDGSGLADVESNIEQIDNQTPETIHK